MFKCLIWFLFFLSTQALSIEFKIKGIKCKTDEESKKPEVIIRKSDTTELKRHLVDLEEKPIDLRKVDFNYDEKTSK